MECVICKTEIPITMKNSIVCSDRCESIGNKLNDINKKYFPTNGCDNCWSDLHHGCSEKCNKEFADSLEFGQDLWSIIRLIYPN